MTTATFSTQRVDPYNPPTEHLQLQQENPISRVQLTDGRTMWAVTKHADVRAVLGDARFSSDRALPGHPMNRGDAWVRELKQLIEMDPPDHTQQRVRVMGEFTVKKIAAMRPRIVGDRRVDDRRDARVGLRGRPRRPRSRCRCRPS